MSFGSVPPFSTYYGPATATSPGILTTSAQSIAGAKTFTDSATISKDQNAATSLSISNLIALGNTSATASLNVSATGVSGLFGAYPSDYVTALYRDAVVLRGNSTASAIVIDSAGGTLKFATGGTLRTTIDGAGLFDSGGTLRSTGVSSPSTGTGVEMLYDTVTSTGLLIALDRATVTRKAMRIDGLDVRLQPNGTTTFTAATTVNTNAVPMVVKSYLVSTAPAASVGAGAMAYFTDAATAACLGISNGSAWKRSDNAATTVA